MICDRGDDLLCDALACRLLGAGRHCKGFDMAKTVLIVAALTAAQAAAAAAVPANEVFDDFRRASICVIGALIGAFLTVAVFPPGGKTEQLRLRALSTKFGASMLAGVAFTPAGMTWFGLPKTPDYLIAASAFVAVFSVSGLHIIAPRVERVLDRVFGGGGDGSTPLPPKRRA